MNMIDKEHLAVMKKREETIEKVYKEKVHYLDEIETKEDAFREGINAAMQVLNLHLVSGLLPTVTEVSDKCEQDIKSFLNTNTEDELKHYRIAHRRSFEFVIRHIDYNR